jgi:predicted nucleic acid-binding protein
VADGRWPKKLGGPPLSRASQATGRGRRVVSGHAFRRAVWVSKRDSLANEARAEVRDLLAWQPVIVDDAILEQGWKIQDRYRLSFWDSLIVAAARAASCRYLLTEDLQPDQDLDGVVVVDPFSTDPESLLGP